MKKKTIYIVMSVAAAALVAYGVYRKRAAKSDSDSDSGTGKPAGTYGGMVFTPVDGGVSPSNSRRYYPKAAVTSVRPVSFSMFRRMNKVPSFTLAGENKLSK